MDLQIVKTQTNMGKECLIVDGCTFRRDSILKSGEISWRCSLNRQICKAKIREIREPLMSCNFYQIQIQCVLK